MRIFERRKRESIAVGEADFSLLLDDESAWSVRFDAVTSIECYKRDELTTDLICLDIWFQDGGQLKVVWIHEEFPGWDELTTRFGSLPGFDPDWYAKVVQPPFAESRILVYGQAG